MSHTSTISAVKIVNIKALRSAITNLNARGIACSLVENEKPRAFYPNQQGLGKADFVVRLSNASYDVGLYKAADGSYEARTDFWGGSVERCLGGVPTKPEREQQAKLGFLFQEYAAEAAVAQARAKGHMAVRRFDSKNNRVTVEITGNI